MAVQPVRGVTYAGFGAGDDFGLGSAFGFGSSSAVEVGAGGSCRRGGRPWRSSFGGRSLKIVSNAVLSTVSSAMSFWARASSRSRCVSRTWLARS
jgi:hypothetical protein